MTMKLSVLRASRSTSKVKGTKAISLLLERTTLNIKIISIKTQMSALFRLMPLIFRKNKKNNMNKGSSIEKSLKRILDLAATKIE
jgi:hypothetical protein